MKQQSKRFEEQRTKHNNLMLRTTKLKADHEYECKFQYFFLFNIEQTKNKSAMAHYINITHTHKYTINVHRALMTSTNSFRSMNSIVFEAHWIYIKQREIHGCRGFFFYWLHSSDPKWNSKQKGHENIAPRSKIIATTPSNAAHIWTLNRRAQMPEC